MLCVSTGSHRHGDHLAVTGSTGERAYKLRNNWFATCKLQAATLCVTESTDRRPSALSDIDAYLFCTPDVFCQASTSPPPPRLNPYLAIKRTVCRLPSLTPPLLSDRRRPSTLVSGSYTSVYQNIFFVCTSLWGNGHNSRATFPFCKVVTISHAFLHNGFHIYRFHLHFCTYSRCFLDLLLRIPRKDLLLVINLINIEDSFFIDTRRSLHLMNWKRILKIQLTSARLWIRYVISPFDL